MSLSSLLDQKLTLQRQSLTRDASGGLVRSFTQLSADIPATVAPASAKVVTDYARRDMIVDHHIYTTTDLDAAVAGGVRLGDRLTDGVSFYLVKAVKRTANKVISSEVVYEMDCEKRT
jgi:head-tail adaptor